MEEDSYVYDNLAFPEHLVNTNGATGDSRIEIFVVSQEFHHSTVDAHEERGATRTQCAHWQCLSFSRNVLAHVYKRRGLLFVALSSLFYSFKYILMDILSSSISSHQAVVMIMPVLLIASLVILLIKRIPPPKQLRPFIWLLISGLSLACYLCLFALSLTYIDVGDSVTILNASLIFVGPLSWILLRERTLTLTDFLFALLAFAGVVFIARPPFLFRPDFNDYDLGDYNGGESNYEDQLLLLTTSLPFGDKGASDNLFSIRNPLAFKDDGHNFGYRGMLLGTGLAFGASVCLALLFTSVRRQTRDDMNVYMIMFSGAIIVMAANALVCTISNSWTIPASQDWIYATLTGGSYFLAQSCLYLSLSLETATSVNIVLTLEIVFTFLWQFLFFDVVPAWTSYAGTSCVLLSCIGHAFLKAKPDETSSNDSGADD